MSIKYFLVLINFLFSISIYSQASNDTVIFKVPTSLPGSIIYEVNVRQYTTQGTFDAFSKHLPRLKEMGVDIIWLMPIFPISQVKRKGTLGSYYAVSDYNKINPEYGNKESFKKLVDEIHKLGMKVILDWVPNHTGWDHTWITKNPEWYTHNLTADTIIHTENTDWYDVADLNYENKELKFQMIRSMLYWLDGFEVDGFRMDVAGMVPDVFWAQLSRTFNAMNKNPIMLAEAEEPAHRNKGYFQMDYGWTFQGLIRDIYSGKKNALDFQNYYNADKQKFMNGWHMYFTSNHDENSWAGTEFEKLGSSHQMFSVLTFTLDGIPLIYSGQEEPLKKKLAFFEKDNIDFDQYAYAPFYKNLCTLRKNNKALYSGTFGGPIVWIQNDKTQQILSFKRTKDDNEVLVVMNMSPQMIETQLSDLSTGKYVEYFSSKKIKIKKNFKLSLQPWAYQIYIKQNDH